MKKDLLIKGAPWLNLLFFFDFAFYMLSFTFFIGKLLTIIFSVPIIFFLVWQSVALSLKKEYSFAIQLFIADFYLALNIPLLVIQFIIGRIGVILILQSFLHLILILYSIAVLIYWTNNDEIILSNINQ